MPLFGPPNVAKLEAKRDVKGLIQALAYPKDSTVRVAAAEALDRLGWRPDGAEAEAVAASPAPEPGADARVVRVFVSSTFRDMGAERDELVKRVFPQLRKMCESRGVTWGEVDLRWGLTDEQKAEGKVLPMCLAEIRGCRPFFLGLLGERYGWVPDALDPALVEQEPWLAQQAGHSVTELFGKSVRPTIEKMKKKRDVKGLIEALGDEDGDVRIAASMALDQMNDDPRVKEALVAALKDEAWVVRAGAAVALATTRDPRAVEALIAALKYEDRECALAPPCASAASAARASQRR